MPFVLKKPKNPTRDDGIDPERMGLSRGFGRSARAGLRGLWPEFRMFTPWMLSLNLSFVAAGVSPAVKGGVSPPGIPFCAKQGPTPLSAGQDARLYGRRDARRYDNGVLALLGSWPVGRSISNREHSMNRVR